MRASRALFAGVVAVAVFRGSNAEADATQPRSRNESLADVAPAPSASGTSSDPTLAPTGNQAQGPTVNEVQAPAGNQAQGPTGSRSRSDSAPLPSGPSLELGQHFVLDPVADGTLTAIGLGLSGLLGLVLSTGEITPPSPAISASGLLAIDRIAVTQKIDPNAGTYSYIVLYGALGWAVADTVLSGFRDGWDAAIVDGFMYAESISLSLALTDITKIAVRRPRPIDYLNCAPPKTTSSPGCASTDLGLSFFSGHAAIVSSIGATATYLAFVRSPDTWRPWVTLAASVVLTTFVSYERVRSGEHFPTDVIAGSLAGAGIGILVPHLHRHKQEPPAVWVGFAPIPHGASAVLNGSF
ncbi:MAG TPA: phosphatase PAP2 family protein [Polyangiaceae bacterium]|nr:phosphatase PAP2 family protein [Polyangiaceae bacterium]